jgi:hypothetical protein
MVVLVVSRRHQLLTSIPASCGGDGSSEIEDDCAVAPCFAGETGVSWWCWFFGDRGRLNCGPVVHRCVGATAHRSLGPRSEMEAAYVVAPRFADVPVQLEN